MSNESEPGENTLVKDSNSTKRLVFISLTYGAAVTLVAPLLSSLAAAHGLVPAARVEALVPLLMLIFCLAFGMFFPRFRIGQGKEITAAVAVGAGGVLTLLICVPFLKVNVNLGGLLLTALNIAASYGLLVWLGFALRGTLPSPKNDRGSA